MDGKILGERIVEARKARDLTQEHLAATIGIDRSALGLIEKGKRKVSAIELVDLAAALSTPLAWFVRDPLAAVISRRHRFLRYVLLGVNNHLVGTKGSSSHGFFPSARGCDYCGT